MLAPFTDKNVFYINWFSYTSCVLCHHQATHEYLKWLSSNQICYLEPLWDAKLCYGTWWNGVVEWHSTTLPNDSPRMRWLDVKHRSKISLFHHSLDICLPMRFTSSTHFSLCLLRKMASKGTVTFPYSNINSFFTLLDGTFINYNSPYAAQRSQEATRCLRARRKGRRFTPIKFQLHERRQKLPRRNLFGPITQKYFYGGADIN